MSVVMSLQHKHVEIYQNDHLHLTQLIKTKTQLKCAGNEKKKQKVTMTSKHKIPLRFYFRNVKRMKDFGKSIVWPHPPSVLEGMVKMLQVVHHRYAYNCIQMKCPLTGRASMAKCSISSLSTLRL